MTSTATEPSLRERNKIRRRNAILDAARKLLRGAPDREPTKADIAAAAEVAPATVYNLIGDRGQLWQALADDFFGELNRRLDTATARDPLDRIRQVVDVTVTMFIEDPAVSTAVLRRWEASGLVLRGGPVASLVEALRIAQAQGILVARIEIRALANCIATGCVGAVHQWAAGQLDDARLRSRARLTAELAISAIATDDHRASLLRSVRRRAAEDRR